MRRIKRIKQKKRLGPSSSLIASVLLRIVDGIPCKELGRQTGGRPSPMEQLTTQVGNKEKVREKIRVRVWCHTRYENKTFYGCAPTVFYSHNFTAQTAVCELHLLTSLTVELSTRLGKACCCFLIDSSYVSIISDEKWLPHRLHQDTGSLGTDCRCRVPARLGTAAPFVATSAQ